MELFVAIWIMCAITSAVIAVGKGRSGFGWFLMGLLFAIFGVIMIACLPAKQLTYAHAGHDDGTRHSRAQNAMAAGVLVTLIILLAMLTACSTATELASTDGHRQLLVRCGTATIYKCEQRAAEECGGAYDVIDTDQGYQANSMHVRCA